MDEFPEVEAATRVYPDFTASVARSRERFNAVGLFAEKSLFDIFTFPLVRGSFEAFDAPTTCQPWDSRLRRGEDRAAGRGLPALLLCGVSPSSALRAAGRNMTEALRYAL